MAVHPRACGERLNPAFSQWLMGGSSPRLRGTVTRGNLMENHMRFIPAPAGNGICRSRWMPRPTVHPRACGERFREIKIKSDAAGSSPRLRGTVRNRLCVIRGNRFIPAPAGNGSTESVMSLLSTVHPRACGERDAVATPTTTIIGSSPRLRGTGPGSR